MSSALAQAVAQAQKPSPSIKRKREDGGDDLISRSPPDMPIDHSLINQPSSSSSTSSTNNAFSATTGATSASTATVHAQPHLPHHQGDTQGAIPLSHTISSTPTHDHLELLSGSKPAVGTEEWHRQRRDNHKEVERRRRENINDGITELAKIVPGCEKNKGSILARAVQYIQQLKDNETANIEKWTLEKLLTEQTISELHTLTEKLKSDLDRAWREADAWKKTCANAGIKKKQDD
ncbi:uncharacterized protein V1518DRAFT_411479 [Limtongia smithiae]|uniref:uncharacterized protein n=1 Tax=Limtongia smithiae TaxID=1125753 RepID=UPI0034CF1492